MNVISAYLDTMFTAYPASPRLREAKAELHGMMEDAYSGYIESGLSENEAVGRVITEFGNLDELAPVLGITTEIAPVASETADAAAHPHVSPITQQEATLYGAARQRTEPQLAQGVALLVASPATLVMLSSLGTAPWAPFTTNTGSLIGLIVLLVMALAGVLLIVKRSQQLAPFSNITSGAFRRSPGVELWARSLAEAEAPQRSQRLQIAIALFVLAALPPIVFSLAFTDQSNVFSGVGVALTLVMVAAGLLIFLPSNWAAATLEALTKSGTTEEDDGTGIIGVIAAIYWPLLTTIFLAWGLIGNAWDQAWIIWPIGGVLFGAIAGGIGAFAAYRKSRD